MDWCDGEDEDEESAEELADDGYGVSGGGSMEDPTFRAYYEGGDTDAMFDYIDRGGETGGDGVISRAEFRRAFPGMEGAIDSGGAQVDANRDGLIDREEFKRAVEASVSRSPSIHSPYQEEEEEDAYDEVWRELLSRP